MSFNEFANELRELGLSEDEIDAEWKEYQKDLEEADLGRKDDE